MKGIYRFYQDDELVGEATNLITTTGKNAILKYLAGEYGSWAGSIVVGSGATAPTINDEHLEFRWGGGETELQIADLDNSTVISRTTLPHNITGRIREVGLWTIHENEEREGLGGVLLHFNRNIETFLGGTDVDNTDETYDYNVSEQSVRLNPTAGGTDNIVYEDYFHDFSQHRSSDILRLAYFIHDANLTEIEVRIKADDSNYRAYTFAPETTTGYHVHTWTRADFLLTGAMEWDESQEIEIIVTAGASDSVVVLDGFRLDDTNTSDAYEIVSRAILDTPILKDSSQDIDIEYTVELNL